MDQSKISMLTIEVMEEIEQTMPEGEVGVVMLIVEGLTDDGSSTVIWKASDGRKHVTLGLLEAVRLSIGGLGG
jgi:hypothetical protein